MDTRPSHPYDSALVHKVHGLEWSTQSLDLNPAELNW